MTGTGPGTPRTGIIDIGSNSIRLVIYQGPARLPAVMFNEKVMAGLGRGLAARGAIDPEGLAVARATLARFAAMAREMAVDTLRTVATAAVRDASNGGRLIEAAADMGLSVELLSGEDEAVAAGLGVISAIPDADGIVGDLGGGSLELVRISRGAVAERASFPLGVLRLAALKDGRGEAFAKHVAGLIASAGWAGRGKALPLYLVGGSWRALARLDMTMTGYPLPIIHQYAISPARIAQLARTIPRLNKARLRQLPGISGGRSGTLADATALLDVLMGVLGSQGAVASAFGLREGLLYGALDQATRGLDPLIEAAREEGRVLGRFAEHGDLLARWIAPIFADEAPAAPRLRHVACLLADVGWRANPEFRAERGLEVALHGNWVAIEPAERAQVAQALFTGLCGRVDVPVPLERLAGAADLRAAAAWGLAMRLGQRLSGGLAGPLERSALEADAAAVALTLTDKDRVLYGETVQKRHAALADFMGRVPSLTSPMSARRDAVHG